MSLQVSQLTGFGQNRSPYSVEYVATTPDATTQSTYTISVSFGVANQDREIFVLVHLEAGTIPAITSITIGGVAATIGTQFTGGTTLRVACAFAAVPTGTSGNVVIVLDGNADGCSVSAYRVVGRPNAGASHTDVGNASSGSAAALSVNSCTVNAGGFILGSLMRDGVVTGVAATILTENLDTSIDTTFGIWAGMYPIQVASSTPTIDWSWTTDCGCRAAAWAFD